MKIRTQLLASVAASLVLALVVAAGVWFSARQQVAAADEQERAQTTARQITGLLVLTQEYALHLEERAAVQWQVRHAALMGALDAPAAFGADEISELQHQARQLPALFARLTDLANAPEIPFTDRRKELLVDRLVGGIQGMSDSAYRWSREAAQAQRAAERRFHVAASAAIAATVLLAAAQGLFFTRRVLRPLRALERATESIEHGDLSARRQWLPRRDELGDLARRFDAMTDALRQRTEQLEATNASLDREAELRRLSEQRIRSILTHAPDAFISIDGQGLIREWNGQAEQTFGWAREEALGRDLAGLLIPERYRERHLAGMSRFAATGEGLVFNQRIEMQALQKDGSEIPIEMSIAALETDAGWTANAFLHDISERKRVREQIQTSERRLRDITDNLPVLIAYIDDQQRFRFCNGTFIDWLGAEPTEMLGRTVLEVTGPELYEQRRELIERALAGERVAFELSSTAMGRTRHLQTTYVPDVRFDGTVAGIYTLSTDISDLKAVQQQLSQMARFDTLTGLANRRQLNEKLPEVVARAHRSGEAIALMYLDVDRFKSINDNYGHATGDAVLQEFARRVRSSVRATDTVGRLAGDEFVVVLEGLHAAAEPQFVARKIIAAIERPFELADGLVLQVSTSVGIAFSIDARLAPEALLARADAALYEAKAAGRNTFRLATV